MVQESVQPLADGEQLDLMQQLGRVGYWEYDPAHHSFMLPPPSLQLLASMLGTSPHTAPLLRELMSDAERHRFRNALEQARRFDIKNILPEYEAYYEEVVERAVSRVADAEV